MNWRPPWASLRRLRPTRQWLRHGVQAAVIVWAYGMAKLAAAGVHHPTMRGDTWSAELGGWSLLDPVAGVQAALGGGAWPTIAGAVLIPVLVAVVLGRVFCAWVCPAGALFEAGDWLRRLGGWLGLAGSDATLWRGAKVVLLLTAAAMGAWLAVPLLAAVYPPAHFAAELRGWVIGAIGGGTVFLATLLLLELTLSRRLWCRYLCPGGGLLSLLGRFRAVRVRQRIDRCTACGECVPVCGMGLDPMHGKLGPECDSCQACVTVCQPRALGLRLTLHDREERP